MIILKKLVNCKNVFKRQALIYDYALKLEQEYGWKNSIMQGGIISPDGSTIFYYDRSPYNGELEQFSKDRENYEKIINEMIHKGDFISYNRR